MEIIFATGVAEEVSQSVAFYENNASQKTTILLKTQDSTFTACRPTISPTTEKDHFYK